MKREIITMVTFMLVCCFLFMTGCSRTEKIEAPYIKTTVAVTVLPQKAYVEAVCGDLVDVIAMVPPGNSPGNYEPTPLEMEHFSKSAIYFTIGVPTEKVKSLLYFILFMDI